MKTSLTLLVGLLVGALGALALAGAARADFPERPITLVVPFSAGGPADAMGRALAQEMSSRLGEQVIVENKPGAGGALGIAGVARALADGYTLGMAGTGAMIYAPFVTPKPLFDPLEGVAHLTTIVRTPNVLVVSSDSPYRSARDFVDAAKHAPGKLTLASAGVASSTHVVGALFQREAGISMVHVPYKGAAPALQDLMGGQVDAFIAEVPAIAGLVEAGRLRALLVTDSERLSVLPDVPSAPEVGLPKLLADGAYGLVAPPGLPADVAKRLISAATSSLRSPELAEKFKTKGGITQPGSPEDYRRILASEQERWGPIIRAAGIKAQ